MAKRKVYKGIEILRKDSFLFWLALVLTLIESYHSMKLFYALLLGEDEIVRHIYAFILGFVINGGVFIFAIRKLNTISLVYAIYTFIMNVSFFYMKHANNPFLMIVSIFVAAVISATVYIVSHQIDNKNGRHRKRSNNGRSGPSDDESSATVRLFTEEDEEALTNDGEHD